MKFVQSSSTSDRICREGRKILAFQASEWFRVLRINVVVSPTTKPNSELRLSRIRTWKEWLRLAMIHWYLPKEAFALAHLELERVGNKFGTDRSINAQFILSSEPEMWTYFLDSSDIFANERSLFGFINEKFEYDRYHFYWTNPKRPKSKVFRRGYNDHGSRRLPHEQHEAKFDFSFTEEQNLIEKTRQAVKDTIDLLKGWIQ